MEVLGGSSGGSTGQVWIPDHPSEGWAPARVDSVAANGNYVCVDEYGQSFEIRQDQARAVDPVCLRGVDDLLSLGDFNEGALLHNIRVRYFKDEIYTGIGGPILISVNPYAVLPALYSEAKQKFYRDTGAAKSQGVDVHIPPHLFSVAGNSYMAMLGDGKNQSIIISGESGAGKTEATKHILKYFANLQLGQGGKDSKGGDQMSIEQQVLRSNPILEAFGNAKTIRNDNSSRFGKFMEIEFDNAGKIQSAVISNYLLEKPRVVKQQPGERGYHSFYQLCAGAPALPINSVLHLYDSRDHVYIQGLTEIGGVNDAEDFTEMVDCMQGLGFTSEERSGVFRIVAAVLHLGDLEFQELPDTNDGTKIVDGEKAQWISEMLQVELKDFIKVFQFKTLEDPFTKKIIDMPQDEASSSNTRHSMAKVAYSRLFDWLVWRINKSISIGTGRKDFKKIGILDIYGFEVFEWNSFEQLCINFANEKLQQHFNSHMFTLEQKLYSEEGIAWSHIEWQDNRDIIDHLEKKPLGLFCIVDAECLMPKATDVTCLSKVYSSFKNSKTIYKPSRFASTNFGVAHYAGEVIYDITSFIEKNTDKLHADIMNLFKTSKMNLLKSLFTDPRFAPELAQASSGGRPGAPQPKRAVGGAPGRGGAGGGDRAKQNVTVSMMFRQQLDQLVEDLNKTSPRYIRCIKPNANKQAHDFDSIDVQRQLRCAGMLESIRIRRAGYSVRRPFKEFFNRFRVLCPQLSVKGAIDPDYKELSRRLLGEMEQKFQREKRPMEAKSWQIGRSKVFLKEELQAEFEKEIGLALQSHVKLLQKTWRGYKMRKRFKQMRKAAVQVQAALQTMRAVADFRIAQKRNQAALAVQAGLRMAALRITFTRRRNAALRIEKVYRGHKCRQKIGKLKGKLAADKIQRMREEEARNEALRAAQQAAQDQAKALEEMKNQMLQQQKSAEDEARRKLEEQQQSRLNEERVKREQEQELERSRRAQEQAAVEETLRQELLEARKETAKLQGQLSCASPSSKSGASEAEMEHLRRELQDTKREKVRLEVELATAKSSAEYEAVVNEANQLREECSVLRRAKLDSELRLEQRSSQIELLQAQASRAEQLAGDLSALRSAHDELQVLLQKVEAQKATLEDNAKLGEQTRGEVTDLRVEKMRLEGELETAKMREEVMNEKLKGIEKTSLELQQQKQRVMTTECELDLSRKEIERLKDQVAHMSKEGQSSRNEALDQLRSDLLNRIESKPVASGRPSIIPPVMAMGSDDGDGRKTIHGQRALFEQLKQQFSEATGDAKEEASQDEVHAESGNPAREAELEEELRQVGRENVELNIRITSLQDELQDKAAEAGQLLGSNSNLQAELQDLKFQLDQESQAIKRMTAENMDYQARILDSENKAASLRRRSESAEESLVKSEEELRAMKHQCMRMHEEQEVFKQRAQQLQRQVNDAVGREKTTSSLHEESRQLADRYQKIAEDAERSRAENEANSRWLQSENERLKAELSNASHEQLKIRQVVDEVMEKGRNCEEMERQVEHWKGRASHFEREYTQSKQLNNEMTKVMGQMTQAVSERSGESSDVTKQNKMLQKQVEAKVQEARAARVEKDELQKRLDSLEATGSYFQEKCKEVSNELRQVKQETSIATASSAKLRSRVESLQKENEDLKAQVGRLSTELRANSGDTDKVDRYEKHVRDLEQTLRCREQDLESTTAEFAKAQQVNDCLNSLLVLESESKGLLQNSIPITDDNVRSQLDQKNSKAGHVIARLNAIMTAGEQSARPSIPYEVPSITR